MIKRILTFIGIFCFCVNGYAQEKEVKAVIETNFGKMIVKLYITFGRKMLLILNFILGSFFVTFASEYQKEDKYLQQYHQ